jgi:hypothetical protein
MTYLEVTTKGHTVFVTLDDDDLEWARKWRWHWRKDRRKKKYYATRSTWCQGSRKTLYLHVEVHKLRGLRRPSSLHFLVDHIDGDTLNCRRDNLRWATGSMNGKNRNGKAKRWYDARRVPAGPC